MIGRTLGIVGLFAVAMTAASASQSAPAYVKAPTEAEVMKAYPPAALAAGWGGQALLTCKHDAQGGLTQCKAEPEYLPVKGFADAGLSLAPLFRLDMSDPKPVPAAVSLALRFTPPIERPEREVKFGKVEARFSNLAPIGQWWPEFAQRTRTTGFGIIDCKVG